MSNASVAEEATGVAQSALTDLIDRSITLLWDHTPGQPPNLHWCRVWGKPQIPRVWIDFEWFRAKEKRPRNYRFLNHWPVDFLGLAAWYGLDKYIQHMLDLQSGEWESGTTDYLLSCSVGGLTRSDAFVSKLKLIAALLKRGADPNMGNPESTIWGSFLRLLPYYFSNEERWYLSELEKTYSSNTVKALLESGANVHEKIYTNVHSPYKYQGVTQSKNSSPLGLFWYAIELHLSTRSVLQRCFAKEPNFFEVEDPLIASGATLYLECTHVYLRAFNGDLGKWVDPKPSEQQLNQLTNLCEQAPPQRKMLDRKVIEIFENADLKQLFEQAPTDEERRSQSRREEEEQEEQHGTNTDATTEPSSVDAPASPTDEAEGSFHSAYSSQPEED